MKTLHISFSGFLGFLQDSNLLTHSTFNPWLGPSCGTANVNADNSKCINWAGYNTGSFCSMCGRCHKHNVCHNGLKFNLHKGHLKKNCGKFHTKHVTQSTQSLEFSTLFYVSKRITTVTREWDQTTSV